MSPKQQVESHVSCIQCKYDLHGLSSQSNCPECGTEILYTISFTYFVAKNKKGFTHLSLAARYLAFSFLAFLITMIIAVTDYFWLTSISFLIHNVLAVTSVIYATKKNNFLKNHTKWRLFTLSLLAVASISAAVIYSETPYSDPANQYALVKTYIACITATLFTALVLFYFSHLAYRFKWKVMGGHIKGFAIITVCLNLMHLYCMDFLTRYGPSYPSGLLMLCLLALMLLIPIASIWIAILLINFSKTCNKHLHEAEIHEI